MSVHDDAASPPVFKKTLECSTAHIPASMGSAMTRGEPLMERRPPMDSICLMEDPGNGWLVWTQNADRPEMEGWFDPAHGIPRDDVEAFCNLLRWARDVHGCDYVMFDSGGAYLDYFPRYSW